MRKILIAATAVMLTAGASLFGASAAEKLKVGFIYLGPIGDLGWTYQHDLARLAMVKEFGDKVETTFLENVSEGPDSERSIEQLARAGNKLIFTTSFGYMEPTLKVAKKYPKVHFEHATGYKRDANMSSYSARWYQGRYIQGIIAAKMSKSGVLGYIGSFPIPEVVSGINSTILGAQTINPNIKVKIIWANSWFDPGKEADAAKALLDQGADVIMQHTDSPAAMQIASERGKLAFGQDSEMIKFGPKAQLTSIMDNWAPYTNMPDEVKKLAEETEAAIIEGKLFPFKCPVVGQDGKEVECKGGDHLADGQVLGMNFYVKGIDDKIPGK